MLTKTVFLVFFVGAYAEQRCNSCPTAKSNNCFCVFNNNCSLEDPKDEKTFQNPAIRERVGASDCPEFHSCVSIPTNNNAKCGKSTLEPTTRGSAGEVLPTIVTDSPWLVTVSTNKTVLCFGSIIHPKVVLTTKHNIHEYKDTPNSLVVTTYVSHVRVRDSENYLVCSKYQQYRTVEKVKMHGNYSPYNYNDISVLFLTTPLVMNANVSTICLPKSPAPHQGQGFLFHWSENLDVKPLNLLPMKIVSHGDCQDKIRKGRRVPSFWRLHDSFICAGGDNISFTEVGDGGSSLIYKPENSDGYVLVGICSWWMDSSLPEMFVDVYKVSEWIENTLANELIIL